MDNVQMITIIASVLIPMMAGFAWILSWLRAIDKSVNELDKRVTILETRISILETRIGFIERLLEFFSRKNNLDFKERNDP